MRQHYGASPGAWDHFDLVLGLGADLLPVAANPNAGISPTSTLKAIGKVPSVYNSNGQAVGMPKWTEHQTTEAEITRWSKNPELGLCMQTRHVRAIDVDIGDENLASDVYEALNVFGHFPLRTRSNSPKFLVLLDVEGILPKRRLKTEHGFIEFLGTGQQCLLDSTHTSGVRYEWPEGWPTHITALTLTEFNSLWKELEERFAVEESVESSLPTKALRLSEAVANDPIVQALSERGQIIDQRADGMLSIVCPFVDGHSMSGGTTETVYYPPHTGGYVEGHFHCLHASCAHRTDTEFKEAIGIRVADMFDIIEENAQDSFDVSDLLGVDPADALPSHRFAFKHASEFVTGAQPSWIIKDVLPMDEVGMIYGESGSGKSFLALDMMCAVAQGIDWREHKIKQAGSVAYVAAEGSMGAKNRIKAYMQRHDLDIEDVPLFVLGDSPNLLETKDTTDLIKSLKKLQKVPGTPPLLVVAIDTVACVMPGGDENSSRDMGRIISNSKLVHKHTGALVLLIHHSGKDASKGARGWSGVRGALGVEICVTRDGNERVAEIEKQKDGEEGAEYGFTLEWVEVGEDEDGEPVGSCFVKEGEVTPKAQRRTSVGDAAHTVLDGVKEYHDSRGEWPSVAEVHAMEWGRTGLDKLEKANQVIIVDGRVEINNP
jgi:hypothetical protein